MGRLYAAFLMYNTVSSVVEELTADQATCLTSNQIYEMMKYKPGCAVHHAAFSPWGANNQWNVQFLVWVSIEAASYWVCCLNRGEDFVQNNIPHAQISRYLPRKQYCFEEHFIHGCHVHTWSCAHTTTAFLLKMLLLPFSGESQLTCRHPEKHPLLCLLHQPVKETKSNTFG